MSIVSVYYDALVLRHGTGRFHPETPSRVARCAEALAHAGFEPRSPASPGRTLDAVAAVHTPAYVARLREAAEAGPPSVAEDEPFTLFDSPDNPMSPSTFEVSLRAVGLALAAGDDVVASRTRRAFVAIRPPGHHALADRAMGFCFLNGVAVLARDLLRTHGLSRVLIADFDVHHGNGTQELFWEDGNVAYVSVHRYPFYPGTGARDETGSGRGAGLVRNVPLPGASGDVAYAEGFEAALLAVGERFRPEAVLVSAGFDAHHRDPLGGMKVGAEGFDRMTAALVQLADAFAGGRIVSLLEGGYDHEGLAEGATTHLRRLALGAETSH